MFTSKQGTPELSRPSSRCTRAAVHGMGCWGRALAQTTRSSSDGRSSATSSACRAAAAPRLAAVSPGSANRRCRTPVLRLTVPAGTPNRSSSSSPVTT
jgi:hypothetical protein